MGNTGPNVADMRVVGITAYFGGSTTVGYDFRFGVYQGGSLSDPDGGDVADLVVDLGRDTIVGGGSGWYTTLVSEAGGTPITQKCCYLVSLETCFKRKPYYCLSR